MKRLVLILSTYICVFAFSQSLKNRADKEFQNMRYANAVNLYTLYLKNNSTDFKAKNNLAESFYKLKDTKNAVLVYEDLYKNFPNDSTIAFNFGSSLIEEGKTSEAKTVFENIKSNHTNNSLAVNYYKSLTNIENLHKDSANVVLQNLNVNTSNAEFSPVFYKNQLVFSGTRTRNYGAVNVFGWNQTPYLHIYKVDTTSLKTSKLPYLKQYNSYDYLTASTENHSDQTVDVPNDSKTLGYYSSTIKNISKSNNSDTLLVSPISSKINTKYHDGPCVFTNDGNTMFFTRNSYQNGKRGKDKTKVTRLKLYVSESLNGKWSKPKELPFNSNEYSVGHPALSTDNKTLYFVSDMPGGFGSTDIYKVSYLNKVFGKPENLGPGINTQSSEMFPTISKEGFLLFSSKGHGGLGGLDIFATDLKNTGKIKNLGYPINSSKDDFGMSFSSPVKGYLSTNRVNGGFDDDIVSFDLIKPIRFNKYIKLVAFNALDSSVIENVNVTMVTENTNENFTTNSQGAIATTTDLNSVHFYTLTKKEYLPTTKEAVISESFNDDTLVVRVPMTKNEPPTLQCLVTDKETGTPLDNVNVQIKDLKTNTVYIQALTSTSGILDKILKQKKIGDILDVSIKLSKKGYLGKELNYTTKITRPLIKLQENLDLTLEGIAIGADIGKLININPIYFDLNKYNIRPDAATELDKIIKVMKENPTIVIELGSHTDCRSSRAYNLTLSDNRAKSSAAYIVSKGIPKSRIYGKGYGESKLVNNCACEMPVKSTCSELEHQQNRRTEFVIVKM